MRVLVLLAALTALPAAPPTAYSDHVQCGDVITRDTRLDSDLECSFLPEGAGVALTIAAGDLTLDLGGHAILGPPSFNDTAGIASSATANIVIRNGSVRGFDADIVLSGVSDSTVRDVRDASMSVVGDRNTVRNNADTAGIAIRGNENLVTRNTIIGPLSSSAAEWLSVGGDDDVITHNVIAGVRPTSESLTAYGLLVRLHRGLIAHNVITAASPPFPMPDVIGMDVSGDGTVIRKNVASGHEDGFLIRAPVTFTDNLAFSNLDDGIDVDVSGATLTRNEANDNGDLGIEAVPATIDGGQNRAAGNGNPAQCTGVVCG